ncbi:MAG: hypothetical protein H6Q86_3276 [candidate division NC10 bacterium]|nr:hypothetical protein [candidate division NC10 bacterium]
MATIVQYTDRKPPENHYPHRIVSPPHSSPCCFSDMEDLGDATRDGAWEYRYRRCRTCGFALRVILRPIPDEALLANLRRELAKSFVRNVPDY